MYVCKYFNDILRGPQNQRIDTAWCSNNFESKNVRQHYSWNCSEKVVTSLKISTVGDYETSEGVITVCLFNS